MSGFVLEKLGCSSRATVPALDTWRRADLCFFFLRFPISANLAPIPAETGRDWPKTAEIGKNRQKYMLKKKKKNLS